MLDGFLDVFEPVSAPDFSNAEGVARIADRMEAHRFDARPMLEGARVALFGVNDGRRSGDNEGCAGAPDAIRHWLYQLVPPSGWQPTVDLGDIRAGATEDDTYAAVQSVIAELVQMGIVPIVLGGGHDLTIPMYRALESVGRPMNLVTVDPRLDFGGDPSLVSSRNHMNAVVMHEPNYLFDYANIGHQGYMTDPDTLELLERLQFDAIRLGTLLANIQHIEPVVRNADLVTIDASAIRASDHPASSHASPNGMTAEHFCQLSRYIGMSDRLLATGFFEHNPDLDDRGRGGHLLAQGVWHVLDGIFNQKGDHPKCSTEDYLKYVVDLPGESHEISFFKSPKSDRWWMDVPVPNQDKSNLLPSLLVPCTYDEYVEAS
ncbi:MAG: formimidoylglutamase, partial [Bacteroidota bacterium]|nr:formimidoylglutamase [Bacteroidota bacterium]